VRGFEADLDHPAALLPARRTDPTSAAYLCGTGGSRYLDPAPFAALGLTVTMFTPPEHAADLFPEDARRISAWPRQDPNDSLPLCTSVHD
jgi:hypothetical protein